MATQPVPLSRAIVAVDIEGSTTRTNTAKARLRAEMYDLLERALQRSGIAERHYDDMVDRGDGVLILIHPVDQVPKTLLLGTFIPVLSEMLGEHNERRPDYGFRMRSAVHAGEIHYDRWAPFGEAIDITCRLLDAPELKVKLTEITAPLVLVVSDDIYRTVIRHGYEGIDDQAFEPLVRDLEVGGHPQRGWVCVPVLPAMDVYPGPESRFDRQRRWSDRLPFIGGQQAAMD